MELDPSVCHCPEGQKITYGLDPYPWAQSALGPGWFFDPRPEYEQDQSKYPA